jgi:hypothetical protein
VRLLTQNRVPILGMAIAVLAVAIGFFAMPVRGQLGGCKPDTTACTYWDSTGGHPGTCGGLAPCQCHYQGAAQRQATCDAIIP